MSRGLFKGKIDCIRSNYTVNGIDYVVVRYENGDTEHMKLIDLLLLPRDKIAKDLKK